MSNTDQSNQTPTINFCIPFIGCGLQYTEFLISNLLETAAFPERISISVSVHSQNNKDLIKTSWIYAVISNIVMAHAYTPPFGDSSREEKFAMDSVIPSANHCSAIRSLYEQATADIVIFSDYDMAFLTHQWDLKIIDILKNHDVCGVQYLPDTFPIPILNGEKQMTARHYQQLPNLSFLAVTQDCLRSSFPQGLSSVDHYLACGELPVQIVHTPSMANTLHLPVGAIWWMTGGYEIPFVIEQNKLTHHTFRPVAFSKQTVFSKDAFASSLSSDAWPDVFVDGISNEPFLAHYSHGTMKSLTPGNEKNFNRFVAAVNAYLAESKDK